MTIYISGPMTGLPDDNFPAFDAAKAELLAQGYSVVSPADMGRMAVCNMGRDRAYAERDTKAILERCQGIYMLNGWDHSQGATAEFFLARWIARSEPNFLFLTEYGERTAQELVHDFALSNSKWRGR